jgi:hypothetical protein
MHFIREVFAKWYIMLFYSNMHTPSEKCLMTLLIELS